MRNVTGMTEPTQEFYLGVRPCGHATAAMRADEATPADIAEFRADMEASGRRVEKRMITRDEFMGTFHVCNCGVGHNYRYTDDPQSKSSA